MKHYRILEKRNISKLGSIYMIQYLKPLFFGLYYWKTIYYNSDNMYIKYEDALNQVKNIIKKEDYDTATNVYHYVDAYKIFKSVKETQKIISKK